MDFQDLYDSLYEDPSLRGVSLPVIKAVVDLTLERFNLVHERACYGCGKALMIVPTPTRGPGHQSRLLEPLPLCAKCDKPVREYMKAIGTPKPSDKPWWESGFTGAAKVLRDLDQKLKEEGEDLVSKLAEIDADRNAPPPPPADPMPRFREGDILVPAVESPSVIRLIDNAFRTEPSTTRHIAVIAPIVPTGVGDYTQYWGKFKLDNGGIVEGIFSSEWRVKEKVTK